MPDPHMWGGSSQPHFFSSQPGAENPQVEKKLPLPSKARLDRKTLSDGPIFWRGPPPGWVGADPMLSPCPVPEGNGKSVCGPAVAGCSRTRSWRKGPPATAAGQRRAGTGRGRPTWTRRMSGVPSAEEGERPRKYTPSPNSPVGAKLLEPSVWHSPCQVVCALFF